MSKRSMTGESQDSAGRRDEGGRVSKRGRRLMVAIIIVLLLALITVTFMLASLVVPRRASIADDDESQGIEWVRSIYGWGTGTDEQLMRPSKIYIEDDGTIWITDPWHDSAYGFSPEGQLVGTVGETADPPSQGFGAIVKGLDGRTFLSEPSMDRMRVFGSDGADLGMFSAPDATDLDYRDGVLLLGARAGFAFIDAESGEPIEIFGSFGQGPDQFDTVGGVCYGDDGRIYLVDSYNNRLRCYDEEGTLIWSVQTGAPRNQAEITGADAMSQSLESSAPANMQLPTDVCMDGSGRLVVSDGLDFTLAVFDSEDGEFIAKYGTYGRLDGQFVYPSSVAYDPDRDWFAVSDAGNSRIQIVRIPDSAAGFDQVAAARRMLSGPLRACLAPLILLLVALIAYVITRRRRRKRQSVEDADVPFVGQVQINESDGI